MQEPCAERQCAAASPALDAPPEQQPLARPDTPPSWTPEHFLQSTLHEGKGVLCLAPVERCAAPGSPREREGEPPKPKGRSRRKQQWKLKFHHQALPPEYLDHYEASLCKARPMAAPPPPHTTSSAAQTDLSPAPLYDINTLPNESIQNWLQRITNIQNDLQRANTPTLTNPPPSSPSRKRRTTPVNESPSSSSASSKIVNYRDLPYMGEMTLNNSKPRRGRKPKKADICHLIYKNYGTIFPGTPGHLVDDRLNGATTSADKSLQIKREKGEKSDNLVPPNKQRTDLQNKIISSLLEKRLSQENRKNKEIKVKKSKCVQAEEEPVSVENSSARLPLSPTEASLTEPLNLCVRDLNNLKIRLLRKHGNVYAKANVECKTELDKSDHESEVNEDRSPVEPVPGTSGPDSVSPAPRMTVLDFKKAMQDNTSSGESDISCLSKIDIGAESPLPGGYVYWPNAGVFVHPLALQSQLLYYQGLAAGNSYTLPPDTSSPDSPGSARPERSTPIPLELEHRSSPGGSSESSTVGARIKRGPSTSRASTTVPTKRKRSAIFIPPMPTDSSASPATEVSICKFKFTGGARPSLQEKKMLSVDSGGNFRYYSGTGDKANRGYEFFPRESLQQSVGAGAGGAAGGGAPLPAPALPTEDQARKKRKSRKSLQREKLEKTFKEKGFLIQTQQLESAEGATYCKFRQLRKFTRYLFRSWKDYLPGAMQEPENGGLPVPALPPPPPAHTEWP